MVGNGIIGIKYFPVLNFEMGQSHKKYYICKFSFNRNKDSEDR